MRLSLSFVSLVAAAAVPLGLPAPVCSVPASVATKGAYLFLEAVKPAASDTVLNARLCLFPPKVGVGSYHALLTFDSTRMRALRVDVTGGMQAKNLAVPGVIKLAGAAPNGFGRGPLATIVFRPVKAGGNTLARIRLTLLELNTPGGASLLDDTQVAGYPSTDRTLGRIETNPDARGASGTNPIARKTMAGPHIDSLSPSSGRVDPESVVEVALYGKGFAADGNTVQFDAATVDRSVLENGGTVLRFIVPTMIPAQGNVQRHRVEAGTYMIKVHTPSGTSNAVRFTVRGEDR